MFHRVICSALDRAGYLMTAARLRLLDWLAGSPPETTTDRAIRKDGERLRKAFPEVDFDDPTPRRHTNGF
jgi:hypothetical protein